MTESCLDVLILARCDWNVTSAQTDLTETRAYSKQATASLDTVHMSSIECLPSMLCPFSAHSLHCRAHLRVGIGGIASFPICLDHMYASIQLKDESPKISDSIELNWRHKVSQGRKASAEHADSAGSVNLPL
jgi:hypothetical protein